MPVRKRFLATFFQAAGPSLVFESDGRWLHPLVELITRLEAGEFLEPLPARAEIYDSISGRAGALLLVYVRQRLLADVGQVQVRAGLASNGAVEIFGRFGMDVEIQRLVDAIDCSTEKDFAEEADPSAALARIRKRIEERRSGRGGKSP